MKLFSLTKKIQASPRGGRELLSKLNQDILEELFGEGYIRYELSSERSGPLRMLRNALHGYVDGVDSVMIHRALYEIEREEVAKVFLDGSNLGGFAQALKQRLPGVEITTFFHNVEVRFFGGALRVYKSPRALAVLLANYFAERKAVKYSDKIICLSERDSRLLKKLYGRGATHIAPMVLEDKYPTASTTLSPNKPPEHFTLFVGGTFYANRAGIAWFVREVVPWIDIPVVIVGKGFETIRTELEIPGKVIVIGEVDSLSDWYCRCWFVIAPIFDGSGMKTKVAEALMYGKKIVGTSEAFSGYETIVEKAGWVCESREEFIAAITVAQKIVDKCFDTELRLLYEKLYSFDAALNRMKGIIGMLKSTRD